MGATFYVSDLRIAPTSTRELTVLDTSEYEEVCEPLVLVRHPTRRFARVEPRRAKR